MAELQTRERELDLSPLRVILSRIEETYHPLQVWLFGSRARGEARPNSYWDLFVVVPDETPEALFDVEVAWKVRKGSGAYADVIPWTVSEFKEDWDVVNSLPHEIARDGILLSER